MNSPPRTRSALLTAGFVLFAFACLPRTAVAVNDAAFVSQSVPASVDAGRTFQVQLTFQNTGDVPWTLGTGFFLGSENPRDNFTWGTNRIRLGPGDSVVPGANHTFTADLAAPSQEGTYDFQWMLLQDQVGWFGQLSQNVSIEVTAPQLVCDGTELVCLSLTSGAEVTASGGVVVGGDFNAQGFMPANQGGIDWEFGSDTDLSEGEMEVTVTGLLPLPGGEQEGGKVSIFQACGLAPEDNESVGIQKMPEDYRDGHIFRYGMDDDGLADNWDAVVITGAGFGCYFSINDPPWQAGESHYFRATWNRNQIELWIDGLHCTGGGNGDTFDPAQKVFTLANRCTHYANQHALARFTNFRLWALGTAVCGNGVRDPGETCDGDCPGNCDDGDSCTTDSLTGSAADCNAECVFDPVTACSGGDGCCPNGCDNSTDSDCSATCGNGAIDPGETCDGNCPTACDDGDPCTLDALVGSAATCSAECQTAPVTECVAGDGCCPIGCDGGSDGDCSATCGDGVRDPGETCDGDCPTDCDDSEACTVDALVGSAANCTAECVFTDLAVCLNGDGCCPDACDDATDDDCQPLEEGAEGGCNCGTSGGEVAWFSSLLFLAILIRRRRHGR